MTEDVEAFYFGEPGRELYGVLHSPGGDPSGAVLLVPPIGHEYVRLHRAMRQFAAQCQTAGLTVLRFDLSGCGDSSGGLDSASFEGWVDDGRVALGELRQRSGSVETCVIGIRLGAAIGACAAAATGGVSSLVLWDPVVNGRDLWAEQRSLHRQMMMHSHVQETTRHNGDEELVGFRWPEALVRGLEQLSPASLTARPADRVLIMDTRLDVASDTLNPQLMALGSTVERRRQPAAELWGWEEDLNRMHVPDRLIREMVDWIRNSLGNR